MSLINDMLKDLEKRRARSLDEPGGALGNLSFGGSAAPSRRHLGVYLGVVLVVLGVLGAAGYLAWKRLGPRLVAATSVERLAHPVVPAPPLVPAPARTMGLASVPSSALTASPPAPVSTPPRPPPGRVAHGMAALTPVAREKPAAPAAAAPVLKVPAPTEQRPRQRPATRVARAEPSAERTGNVEKRQRPLSPAQRSVLAYQRGYALLARGQTSQGEEQLRSALTLDAHNLAARELLAGMYIRTGRLVEAAGVLKEGVRLAPGHIVFAKLYARVLAEQGDPAAAVRVLEQHLDAAHDDVDYLAMLAALYQQAGRHREAVQAYRELVEARPDRGDWWAGLGISLEALGQPAAARQAYQRAQATGDLSPQLQKYTARRLVALKSSPNRAD